MTSVCPVCKRELELNPENFYRNRAQKYAKRGFDHRCKDCRKKSSKGAWQKTSMRAKENKNKSRRFNARARANQMMTGYRSYDRRHGLEFNLNRDFIIELLNKECAYCRDSGIFKLGLDRIGNSRGHTIDNVIPCCHECNTARSDHFTYEEMTLIGKAIAVIKENRIIAGCPGRTNFGFMDYEKIDIRRQQNIFA